MFKNVLEWTFLLVVKHNACVEIAVFFMLFLNAINALKLVP